MKIVLTLLLSLFFAQSSSSVQMTVILETIYMDGEVSEEIREETVASMKDIWNEYKDWYLVDMDDEQIVFQRYVDDLSPLTKAGYFGLTKDGTLSIFEGKPGESSRVIQSFFQIDVKKLESHEQEKLKKGISVRSKRNYKRVIEAYEPFGK
ncbi:forespore regulator of the sigma-K checkpoint [Anoxybacillus pushchinoensis]|uniref:Forespore regulator of the sigma-K checkpoint n=1 Tax=Anoxybacillus pushchinoensis TaxID=150248 RepID=A0A1I0TB12_9BACL|nr:intercompartmental signaling factor BofC [Anoxybacillus pushchinoensis]SFA48186.1 forespore regulator of the sigma-K checkpoint [Anoxybacillus pushchinoensis]